MSAFYLQCGCDPGSRATKCVLHCSQLWMGTGRSVCGSCGASSRTGLVYRQTFYTGALHSWARINTQPLDLHISPNQAAHRRSTRVHDNEISHVTQQQNKSYVRLSTRGITTNFTEIMLQLHCLFLNCHYNKILTRWDYSYKSQCVKEKCTIICIVKIFPCFQNLHFIIIIFEAQLDFYISKLDRPI